MNDQKHFKKTYNQISKRLRKNSLVVFDKGANSIGNTKLIRADKMQYLTAKKLNKSDDKIIEIFDQLETKVIDEEKGIYGYKIVKPNSINYLYFSKTLKKQQLESKARKILRMIKEAKEIQESITKKKKVSKKYLINNVLVKVNYSFQTKLMEISEEEAIKLLEEQVITGREGFFCLKSSENLTVVEALATYRKSGLKNFIYANFDPMNTLILRGKQGIT